MIACPEVHRGGDHRRMTDAVELTFAVKFSGAEGKPIAVAETATEEELFAYGLYATT